MRLIDADKLYKELEDIRMDYIDEVSMSSKFAADVIETVQDEYLRKSPTVDAVEVVRCKECRFAKPYERMDGKTGYYCQFCGHSFKYGTNCERLYNPIKESDDFCSYGERKEGDGNG